MASVTLASLWLNRVSDLTDSIVLSTMTGLTSTPQNAGAVRRYANGRMRIVTQAGVPNQFQVTTVASPRATIQWLEGHTGQTVLVRDDRGRKFYATYFQPATAEHAYNGEGDVTFTLSEVTYSESGVALQPSVLDGGTPSGSGSTVVDGGTP